MTLNRFYSLRTLTHADIPLLPQINPTFTSETELVVTRSGAGLEVGWSLVERPLATPYNKGHRYDFDLERQTDLKTRLDRAESDGTAALWCAVNDTGRLIGVIDCTYEEWQNAVTIWTLFVDLHHRGQGVGRQLWTFAKTYGVEMGARALLIETQTNNVPACRFYARMGCQLVGIHEALYAYPNPEVAVFWRYPLS
jgi:ribosomal protein S18 acetylase RimI-like enzyme